MRFFICLFIPISLFLCSCSFTPSNTVDDSKVKINYPADKTVNGYRDVDSSVISSEVDVNYMPDIIHVEETEIIDTTVDNNDVTRAYFGNKNSKKFHKSSCSSSANTKEENKIFLKSRDAFIAAGFSPCSKCNP